MAKYDLVQSEGVAVSDWMDREREDEDDNEGAPINAPDNVHSYRAKLSTHTRRPRRFYSFFVSG